MFGIRMIWPQQTDYSYMREKNPRYDFAKSGAPKNGVVVNASTEKKPIAIQRRKEATAVSGGC